MNKKFFKQNRVLLLIIFALFILFASVILYSGRKIYEGEVDRQRKESTSRVLSGKKSLELFFSSFVKDLERLKASPSVKNYVNGNLKSDELKEEVKDIFINLIEINETYSNILLVDREGNRIIRIDNNFTAFDIKDAADKAIDMFLHRFFREFSHRESDDIYLSPAGMGVDEEKAIPFRILSAILKDSNNKDQGGLILNINLSRIFDTLPDDMFIQTGDGYMLSRNQEGVTGFEKSPYEFQNESGLYYISDTESIEYRALDILRDRNLFVAAYENFRAVKGSLLTLVLWSVAILIVFLSLIFYIVYINMIRFMEFERAQKAVLSSLAGLAEGRDPETGRHLERTRNYSTVLTKSLQKNSKYRKVINSEFLEALYDASPLHDIGKVGVRDSILLKEGKLSEGEFEEMKRHVWVGKNVLQNAIDRFKLKQPLFIIARNICAYHHEKYDGSGYHEGLRGEEIPLEARIFAICDVYDALRTRRPYKDEMSHEETAKIIKSASGEHFDPDIVEAFTDCEEELQEIHDAYKHLFEVYGQLYEREISGTLVGIDWSHDLSVGVEKIDLQHKELFHRINQLLTSILSGNSKKEAGKIIKFLEEYATLHFKLEEEYMTLYNYPDYSFHKSQHMEFVDNLLYIKGNIESAGLTSHVNRQLQRNVCNWLINHIATVDKAFGEFFKKRL